MKSNQHPLYTIQLGQDRSFAVTETTVLLAIIAAGALLRLVALGRWSLWTDELYNLGLMPVSRLLAEGTPADQHPPLYYLVLEAVLNLGHREWLMRLPSAAAGILSIPMVWLAGRALKRPRLGLLAAALLALAPLHIWYSREARMYGLAFLFWTAAIYFYIQILERDKWLDVLGLSLTMTAGLYTAYPTLALWFGQMALFFYFWHRNGRKRIRLFRWLAAQAAIGVLFAGWLPFLQKQLERPLVFNWLNFLEPLVGPDIAGRFDQALVGSGFATTLAGTFQLAFLAGLVLIILSVLFSWVLVRRPSIIRRIGRFEYGLALLITGLFVLVTIASEVPRGLSIRRQLLVFLVPFLMFAAWALLRLKNRRLLAGAVALSFVLAIMTVFGDQYEDWRSTVGVIAEAGQPGDLIFLSPAWSRMAFDYYYEGSLPYDGINAQQAQQNLEQLSGARRVWLVVNRHPSIADQTMGTEKWFAQNSVLVQTYNFPLYMTVYELVIDPP